MEFTIFAAMVSGAGALQGSTGIIGMTGDVSATEIVFESDEDALARDLSLAAQARAWTNEEAAAYYRSEQAIGALAGVISATRPDTFVGSALAEDPSEPPTLYLKGIVDVRVLELVERAPIPVAISDNQPYSFEEQQAFQQFVVDALEDLGYRSVSAGADIRRRGILITSVTREEGLPATAEEIVALLPIAARSRVELSVVDRPLAVGEAAAFGGMWLLVGPNHYATSGWTVSTMDDSIKGISGPGHGSGISQVEVPGQGLFGLSYQAEHQGVWETLSGTRLPRVSLMTSTPKPASCVM